jgi:hypothetical protein
MFWRMRKTIREENQSVKKEITVQELQETIGAVARNLEDSLSKLDQLLSRIDRESGGGNRPRTNQKLER